MGNPDLDWFDWSFTFIYRDLEFSKEFTLH